MYIVGDHIWRVNVVWKIVQQNHLTLWKVTSKQPLIACNPSNVKIQQLIGNMCATTRVILLAAHVSRVLAVRQCQSKNHFSTFSASDILTCTFMIDFHIGQAVQALRWQPTLAIACSPLDAGQTNVRSDET